MYRRKGLILCEIVTLLDPSPLNHHLNIIKRLKRQFCQQNCQHFHITEQQSLDYWDTLLTVTYGQDCLRLVISGLKQNSHFKYNELFSKQNFRVKQKYLQTRVLHRTCVACWVTLLTLYRLGPLGQGHSPQVVQYYITHDIEFDLGNIHERGYWLRSRYILKYSLFSSCCHANQISL